MPKALSAVLAQQGIEQAFPIQEKTLPDSLAGRDVLGRGKTGSGKTVAAASTLDKGLKGALPKGSDLAAAQAVGKLVAERAIQAGVKEVVFDRGGYLYHGRVKALAEAAREAGLNF